MLPLLCMPSSLAALAGGCLIVATWAAVGARAAVCVAGPPGWLPRPGCTVPLPPLAGAVMAADVGGVVAESGPQSWCCCCWV